MGQPAMPASLWGPSRPTLYASQVACTASLFPDGSGVSSGVTGPSLSGHRGWMKPSKPRRHLSTRSTCGLLLLHGKASVSGFAICYNRNQSSRRREMATTTTTPTTTTPSVDTRPMTFTPTAVAKVKEVMAQQNPIPAGLRVGVVGGGCSGFQYSMSFENGAGMMDKTFNFDDLKVFVDATSLMYLKGVTVDYIETLEGAGFKFDNPNVKSTCGCGSSFNV